MQWLLRRPVRLVPIGFGATILIGTLALMLPWATGQQRHTPFVTALFTSASAVSVTGLAVVDTPNYWNDFGLAVITILTQVGGLGIVTGATLVILAVSHQLGLRNRLLVQAETAEFGLGDVRRLLFRIAAIALTTEAIITVILTLRLWVKYDYAFGEALWTGVFHAVQAFNNGGFALYSDGLIGLSSDAWLILPMAFGALLGGLGFPALFEAVRSGRRPRCWSVSTKLTIWGSVTLVTVGFLALLATEWSNPYTLGIRPWPEKILAAFAQNAFFRTGGFNVINIEALGEESIPAIIALMFIGGGSASTAGGIKVSTFFLLAFVIWAELRGEPDVTIRHRRIATASQRQAVTVALLGVAIVVVGTVTLILLTQGVPHHVALFEVTSAFSTAGLSLGVAPDLPDGGQYVLIVLMYIGRVGSLTLGSALALNTRRRLYRYPEEQPLVG
ncbi:TrkH family potassium uptake protein [Salinispora tropica]|uniref:H(+)-transporting two-sector ATPase n=1 Tax=Salinispora tropica (strain ATCC BAA-916 / DSM 44818 / JCM 13857 / NBRC 105044 / CNB-440) TaxID=369723 RepID=A4X1V8_SALTO|nr:potassium transporter TrkG [Salinispora tropica]ABP52858.1 H(+)-transporting two-sector ATPase [Salinispora tropica CNB-440]